MAGARIRLSELDLLRFFAALSVAIYHFTLWPADGGKVAFVASFGFLGVPLFFMISGFVILMTAEGRTPTQFVNSRLSRLYPTFWVSVLVTTVVVLVLLRETAPTLRQLLANLTMFPAELGEKKIDGVYWSLVVEMKFYGLVLLLLVFRQARHVERWLLVWLAGAALALFDAAPPLLRTLTLHPWGSLFIAGCLLYRMHTQDAASRLLLPFCAAMCVSLACVVEYQDIYTQSTTMGTRVAAALLVVALHLTFLGFVLRLWALPDMRLWFWLGALTYPLYLLHARAGKTVWQALPGNEWLRLGVVLLLVLGASLVLAMTVERHGCRAAYRWLDAASVRVVAWLEVCRTRILQAPRDIAQLVQTAFRRVQLMRTALMRVQLVR